MLKNNFRTYIILFVYGGGEGGGGQFVRSERRGDRCCNAQDDIM